jgi:hypothetical protein
MLKGRIAAVDMKGITQSSIAEKNAARKLKLDPIVQHILSLVEEKAREGKWEIEVVYGFGGKLKTALDNLSEVNFNDVKTELTELGYTVAEVEFPYTNPHGGIAFTVDWS